MEPEHDPHDPKQFWNLAADDWKIQVGTDGDANRQMNSDPILWEFAGKVAGLKVLDAGCGTGYLTRKLSARGAQVTGVDFSEEMIRIAQRNNPKLTFRLDSCCELETCADSFFDLVIANYVLMDVDDLPGTMLAFERVLKPGGTAVLVFSHPCFPQSKASVIDQKGAISYRWDFNYFEESKQIDPPWAHFTNEFIWFHRPLSAYWKAFTDAGFEIVELDEPRVTPDRYHLAQSERQVTNSRIRPYSIAFKLLKK